MSKIKNWYWDFINSPHYEQYISGEDIPESLQKSLEHTSELSKYPRSQFLKNRLKQVKNTTVDPF